MKLVRPALAMVLVLASLGRAEAQRGYYARVGGTSTIAGRVTAADGETPIPRANVSLTGDGYRTLLTDDDGRYRFSELPTGQYIVSAGATGYVTLAYGERMPFEGRRPVDLEKGETAEHIDMALPRSGVIEVTVTDETGAPREGVKVQARRCGAVAGRMETIITPAEELRGPFTTSDLGRVRLFDLAPGNYCVSAAVFWGPPSTYPLTYYPGTASLDEAKVVTLALGAEVDIHLPIRPMPVAPAPAPAPVTGRVAGEHVKAAADTETPRISGRVLAADGSGPVAGAEVLLTDIPTIGRSRERRTTMTDARGGYEFTGLPDGRYTLTAGKIGFLAEARGQQTAYLAAQPLVIAAGRSFDGIDLTLTREGVIIVHVIDEAGRARAGVDVQALRRAEYYDPHGRLTLFPVRSRLEDTIWTRTSRTDDRGEIRLYALPPGEYWVKAEDHREIMAPPVPQDDRSLIYPPTYAPGVTLAKDAEPLTIAAGEEQRLDIALIPARAARVSGSVVTSNGTPSKGYVFLKAMDGNSSDAWTSDTLKDGKFEFWDVKPGEYKIEKPIDDDEEFEQSDHGSIDITVASEDLSDLLITTEGRGVLSGQLVFEGGEPPTDGDARLDLTLVARGGPDSMDPTTDPAADWTFSIDHLTEPAVLRLFGDTSPWVLKEIRLGGDDVTDTPLRQAEGLRVVLTRQNAILRGTVIDDGGAPVTGAGVLIFPEDPARRASDRFIARGRSNEYGLVSEIKLLPGRYLAVAGDPRDIPYQPDAETLNRLAQRAMPLTLGEGDTKSIMLTFAPR